jgi:hypothetical protein
MGLISKSPGIQNGGMVCTNPRKSFLGLFKIRVIFPNSPTFPQPMVNVYIDERWKDKVVGSRDGK